MIVCRTQSWKPPTRLRGFNYGSVLALVGDEKKPRELNYSSDNDTYGE
jgi:hypothetical protein